jgi:hypothetical protein
MLVGPEDTNSFRGRRAAKLTETALARVMRALEKADGRYIVEIAPDGTIRIVPRDEKSTPTPRKETIL